MDVGRAMLWTAAVLWIMIPVAAHAQDQDESRAHYEVIERPQQQGDLQKAHAASFTLRPAEREVTEEFLSRLDMPAGFEVSIFARDLENPRIIRVAPDGRAYVTERDAGRVRMLHDSSGDGMADLSQVVAEGLDEVHGLAIHDGWLYMVGINDLWRAQIGASGLLDEPELLRDDLPDAGQHPNRTLAVGPDGMLYLSIGSTTNAIPEPEPLVATISRAGLDGSNLRIFAEGLRNTIGFDWHPSTGDLWGMDHGSDMRGNDIPPEELNRIEERRHYGWPFCFGDREADYIVSPDPEEQTKEMFCAGTEPMALGYTAHAAPMQLLFYRGNAFPDEYRSGAFATMRGSWNRSPASGYEIVQIEFDDAGAPQGISPFVSGWVEADGSAQYGRLVGLAEANDGSLLVTDDTNGIVYRISYTGTN